MLRYASRLALASSLLRAKSLGASAGDASSSGARPAVRDALKKLEKSIGEARKAYRIGKFLAGLGELRELLPSRPKHWVLKSLVAGGDAAYYGVEQLVWLARIDVIPKRHLHSLDVLSNACGLVSYLAGMRLSHLNIAEADGKKRALLLEAIWIQAGAKRIEDDEEEEEEEEEENGEATGGKNGTEKRAERETHGASENRPLRKPAFPPSLLPVSSLSPASVARLAEIDRELTALARAKKESAFAFAQDFAEAVMALATVREDVQWLNGDALQASMGLVSGLVSTRKNWNKVVGRKK